VRVARCLAPACGAVAILSLVGGCSDRNSADECAGVICVQGRICVSGRCQEAGSCEGKTCLGGTICVNGACVPVLDGSSGDGASCTPQGTEKGKATCGPCQQAERTCQANGSWGPWGACQDLCAKDQLCKDEKCLACEPGKTQSRPCVCGTETRTCSSDGSWSDWGACVQNCKDPFKCENGRCTSHYAASSSENGPICQGYCAGVGLGYYNLLLCKRGDTCETKTQCRGYQEKLPSDTYRAYPGAGGVSCGQEQQWPCDVVTYQCEPGDNCDSASEVRCKIPSST